MPGIIPSRRQPRRAFPVQQRLAARLSQRRMVRCSRQVTALAQAQGRTLVKSVGQVISELLELFVIGVRQVHAVSLERPDDVCLASWPHHDQPLSFGVGQVVQVSVQTRAERAYALGTVFAFLALVGLGAFSSKCPKYGRDSQ